VGQRLAVLDLVVDTKEAYMFNFHSVFFLLDRI